MAYTFYPADPYAFYFTSVNYLLSDGSQAAMNAATRELWFDGLGKFYEGRLKQPGLLSQNMFKPNCTRGVGQIAHGAIVLENSDGSLDYLMNYALDGQPLNIGRVYNSIGTRYYMFTGVTEQPTFSLNEVTISIRDTAYVYQKAALPTKYAGTNVLPAGVEGTPSDLKGQPKPMVLGIVKNITPRFVNTSLLIYQVDGQQGLLKSGFGNYSITVYDKRVVLTAGAEYPDQATMESTAPAAGQYRVWPAGGCFRLGSTPAGQITADVTNPCWSSPGAIPARITACEVNVLMYALMAKAINNGGLPNFFAFWPLVTSPAANFPNGGIYLDQEISYYDAINQLAASVSAGWGTRNSIDAAYYVDGWQMRDPLTPGGINAGLVLGVDETQILEITRTPIADDDNGIPVWRVNLNYLKNYTVQTSTDVGSASPADLAFVQLPYCTVTVSDATVKTQWPNAAEINIDTLLVDSTAATNEANRLLSLYKVRRDIFNVKVPDSALPTTRNLNIDVLLTHSRFGLAAGRRMVLIGYQPNPKDNNTVLTLWG